MDGAISTLRNVIAVAYLAWIGFLLYYFSGFASNPMVARQLGPTVMGLTVIFTLGATFMLLKLVRAASRERARKQIAAIDGQPEFDAEGAIERYMAKRGTAERAPVFDDSALHGATPAEPTSRGVDLPSHPAPRGFGKRGL